MFYSIGLTDGFFLNAFAIRLMGFFLNAFAIKIVNFISVNILFKLNYFKLKIYLILTI